MSYFLTGYKSASALTDAEIGLISGGHDGPHESTIHCYLIGSVKVCEHKVDPSDG